MSTPAPDVVIPALADADDLAQVLSLIQAHEARRGTVLEPSFFLSGANERDRVELTEQVHTILKQIVQALSKGQSISVKAAMRRRSQAMISWRARSRARHRPR
jgi:hypothetical protein